MGAPPGAIEPCDSVGGVPKTMLAATSVNNFGLTKRIGNSRPLDMINVHDAPN